LRFFRPAFYNSGVAKPRRKLSVTPFSAGKFELFCRSRGRTVEEISTATGITLRTMQRWMTGETFPVAESWVKLAKAFDHPNGDELMMAYSAFLSVYLPADRQDEAAPHPHAGRFGDEFPPSLDAVREALRPLRRILDLDLSGIKPKSREILLHRTRGTLLTMAGVIETEYANFYQYLEK
jgi:transcriptional regulator with XRE-family HTH domain